MGIFRIDAIDVTRRVSQLLREHPDLIMDFSVFLPLGHMIEVEPNGVINLHVPGQSVINMSAVPYYGTNAGRAEPIVHPARQARLSHVH